MKQRYFLITYILKKDVIDVGELCISSPTFVSRYDIYNNLLSKNSDLLINEFITVNILEFKNKKDYLSYQVIEPKIIPQGLF